MGTDPPIHDSQPAPFIGARPFTMRERALFFGRMGETAKVSDLWRNSRLTVLYGSAGVGKTSLLCAGVIPQLEAEFAHVLPLGHISHRTAFPMAALPEQNPYVFALLTSWFRDEPPALLAGASIGQCVGRHTRRDRFGAPSPLFLAIDQTERLFRPALTYEAQRLQALEQLAGALTSQPHLHLLMAVREDLLQEALRFAGRIEAIRHTTCRLRPLDENAALEAVRRPLDKCGLLPGAGAVHGLVEELRTPRTSSGAGREEVSEVEPALLQVVCTKLWKRLPADQDPPRRQLADEIDRALAESCTQALATIAVDHRLPPRDVTSWFRASFSGRRSVSADEQPMPGRPGRIPTSVLRAAEDRHLIKVRRRADDRWYELHPRLVKPIGQMSEDPGPVRGPDPPGRLDAARSALADGDHSLARHHVQAAIRAARPDQMRILADAESFLGNIAYEQGDLRSAEKHYRNAATMYETMHDTPAVGRLLAALGRLKLIEALDTPRDPPCRAPEVGRAHAVVSAPVTGRPEPEEGPLEEPSLGPATTARQVLAAATELRAAAERVPNDTAVQTLLAQALWHAGQQGAALAALGMAIGRDCADLHALRVRGEYLADLGRADAALQDLRRVEWRALPGTKAAWALAHAGAGQALDRMVINDLAELAGSSPTVGASGPFLLRVARLHGHVGADAAARQFAVRALAGSRPPLPPHLIRTARELIGSSPPA